MPIFSTLCDDCGRPDCPECNPPRVSVPLEWYWKSQTFTLTDAECRQVFPDAAMVQRITEASTRAADAQFRNTVRAYLEGR